MYTEVHACLGLVGHYRRFIKGFACIAQPLNEHLAREGASRKSELVSFSEDALKAFEVLKHACMTAFSFGFCWLHQTIFVRDWCIQGWFGGSAITEAGRCRWYHPVTYGSRALMPHEKNYHLTKLEFLALKWAVTEHFKEYLPYQSFLVKTDNNPLTYIMMTPNLDATSHQWVSALAWFNFELEYQKGCDNTVVDALHWVTTQLDPDMVKSILNGVALGSAHWAKVHDATIVEGDCHLEQEVCVTAGHVLGWLKAQNKTDLKALLAEHTPSDEGQLILWNQQNFMIHQRALYLHSMPKGETKDLLLLIVPKAHHVVALNECHRDEGHQGHNHTLSLLWKHFWWLGMANQMQQSIKSCTHCLHDEGDLSKAPLHPIVATALMDLLHVDFTSRETTLELNRPPRVTNVLVFQDHFMKHIMVYVTPNQTAKTVVKYLYHGYISICGALAKVLTLWAASLTRCVTSWVWRNCRPYLTTPRWTGRWRGHTKP